MIDPIILFFLFGLFAGLVRSDLRLPSPVYDFVSMVLLLAIGLKGGVEMAAHPLAKLLPHMGAVFVLGVLLTLLAYPVLSKLGRLSRVNAAAIAAHYGSVSVGTYAVAVAFLNAKGVSFESYMPLLLVVLEIPAIIVGILLAKGLAKTTNWGVVAHEIFAGKGIMLLIGGLLIGWYAGTDGIAPIKPLFFDLFKGFLTLFLLEMGLIAAAKLSVLRQHGMFLVVFGIIMPLVSSCVGVGFGILMGLSLGGLTMLATLAASASYIAVPAAMRASIPEASPTLSLTASLGVTFTFNVLIGIAIYFKLASIAQQMLAH